MSHLIRQKLTTAAYYVDKAKINGTNSFDGDLNKGILHTIFHIIFKNQFPNDLIGIIKDNK